MVICVGTPAPKKSDKKEKERLYTYKDVEFDKGGWADVCLYLPIKFDLCTLKTSEGKVKSGWYTGQGWDGQRVKEEDGITHWNRKQYETPNLSLQD
jgi:hypothetical protein